MDRRKARRLWREAERQAWRDLVWGAAWLFAAAGGFWAGFVLFAWAGG